MTEQTENTLAATEMVKENLDKESLKASISSAVQEALQEAMAEKKLEIKRAIEQAAEAKASEEDAPAPGDGLDFKRYDAHPHAFVVMPFGKKKGADGALYDFNTIYQQLIKPSLEAAGFEAFRADEETVSGDILTDMFQELLLADLVIADMSIDNANVFYELGIRHAFRKRGLVHIQAGRAYMPFDIFNVRTIPYHITAEGIPDPAFIEKDRQAIVRVARDTWASDSDAIHSPIFNLLSGLEEPERKTLRTPLATGFWREYNDWRQRVTVAQRRKRIGDILLLTEEITNPLIKEEAVAEAGKALQNMGRNELALQQYRKGLEINPHNLNFRRQEAIFLNRLGRVDEAIVKLENLLADAPSDTEAISTLGRIYKDMWSDSWKWVSDQAKRLQTAFESYHWLIKAFYTYIKGYRCDLDNTYPGVNALTLGTILLHLAEQYDDKNDPDPDITAIANILPELRGALVFALETQAQVESVDYWTLVSLAELRVMTADNTRKVTRAYRKALTAARRNTWYLQSSLAQLEMLMALNMRVEYVQAGMQAIQDELRRMAKVEANEDLKEKKKNEGSELPAVASNVFVFTGYALDTLASETGEKRFPPEREAAVKQEIVAMLKKLGGGAEDIAFTAGLAAGSDIIFVEACQELGIPVEVHLPMVEAQYIRQFVSPAGDKWVERFYNLRNNPAISLRFQGECVGKPSSIYPNVYARNNRWALYSSFLWGVDKVRIIAVWDGKSEPPDDLNGRLVQNMVEKARDRGIQIEHINANQFIRPINLPDAASYGLLNTGENQETESPLRKRAKNAA
ncbi:MAG: TRAFs-binding domain-containing protein [Chloroflexota bacterium]